MAIADAVDLGPHCGLLRGLFCGAFDAGRHLVVDVVGAAVGQRDNMLLHPAARRQTLTALPAASVRLHEHRSAVFPRSAARRRLNPLRQLAALFLHSAINKIIWAFV